MHLHKVTDWDNAYSNAVHIPGGEGYPTQWLEAAKSFRQEAASAGLAEFDLAYGDGERQTFDLYRPKGRAKGLVVYVHGGYWLAFDKSYWSHLAKGSLDHGYAVAMPSYTLCPAIAVSGITKEIAAAITAAAGMIEGAIRLTGHSAGGHLITRMICQDSPLNKAVQKRIARTVSISGLHDLRPLMKTSMNEKLGLQQSEAIAESAALQMPMENADLVCWVGGAERAEFLRQSALLANVWTGLGAATVLVTEPDKHHFNIIDGLGDADHPLTTTLIG